MASTTCRSLCLFLGLALLCSSALAAERGSSSYPGQIGMYNPCNKGVVIVGGTNYVRVHENAREHHDETHVSIQFHFVGTGEDQLGSLYRTVLTAKGQFKEAASSYDIPYRSMWIGQKDASSFSMQGTLRIWVDAESGEANADNILTWDTACMKDFRSDDHDKDWDDDHDRDSHDDHDRH